MQETIPTYRIAWLPGDGIGREVSHVALEVLEAAGQRWRFRLDVDEQLIGGAAIDARGAPLPDETLAACRAADATLLGAVGGPAWDELEASVRPERGLLALRKGLGVFANLRPVRVYDALAGASPLRRERVAGTDLLIVRELTGGIYFGEPSGTEGGGAYNTMRYTRAEIERVARVAFGWARQRRREVVSVDKANVLVVSRLWREVVEQVQADYGDVALSHLYVDNAAMQLVQRPATFDVLLTGNLFGDILSDLAATLAGSLGLLPSASIGTEHGLFEPVHGSAPDLAGQHTANPIGAILSGAMLLDYLGEGAAAEAIRRAVAISLSTGWRTGDLCANPADACSTDAFGRAVRELLGEEVAA